MTRSRKTSEESTKHGTRTAAGQQRTRARRAERAVAGGLVDHDASRRQVDAAIKAARIEFMRSDRRTWDEVADEFVHIADALGTITQGSVMPSPTMTLQLPMAYAGILVELAEYGGGPVYVRFYKQRPIPAGPAVARALDELERLAGAYLED